MNGEQARECNKRDFTETIIFRFPCVMESTFAVTCRLLKFHLSAFLQLLKHRQILYFVGEATLSTNTIGVALFSTSSEY